MRVFAALPLPPTAVSHIEGALAPVRTLYPRVKWVASTGLHVTLHFFGEVTETGVAALQDVLSAAELQRPPIQSSLSGVGQFPPRGDPRVLWVGLGEGVREMRAFWELFEQKIAPLGWKPDARGFSPHVTVGRVGGTPMGSEWARSVVLPPLGFSLSECVLFQSVLGRTGAEYFPLKTISFTGRGNV